jgi:FkbM family methyltransferase
MTSRLEKVTAGMKADPREIIRKMIRYSLADARMLAENMLSWAGRPLLKLLSPVTLARIKESINPIIRLDFDRCDIFIHADSGLNLRRARACAKEPETVRWIMENVQPGDVFYDVGANVGAYSLIASRYFEGRVQVYAFEPSFSTYGQLCRNIVLNRCQESVHPYPLALADCSRVTEFGYHSLEAGAADHVLLDGSQTNVASEPSMYRQAILGFRLDDLIANYGFPVPNHMKIDVDGSECLVLAGAARTLRTGSLRSLLVEVRSNDGQADAVAELLKASGLEVASKHDRGNGLVWNYIFARKYG